MKGRWVGAIARKLNSDPAGFWLNAALPYGYVWNDFTALHRAAAKLKADGYIRATMRNEGKGHARLWIARGRRALPELPPPTPTAKLSPVLVGLLRRKARG